MARIIYCHPALTEHAYHIFTDLDFWDARRLLKEFATVRRNFGRYMPGDRFPTQVVADGLSTGKIAILERRLRKAIPSPARHMVVRSMVLDGYFEFEPSDYYPESWSREKILRFTYHRLPLQQAALCTPYETVKLSWLDDCRIRLERVRRERVEDIVVRGRQEAERRLKVPSCF